MVLFRDRQCYVGTTLESRDEVEFEILVGVCVLHRGQLGVLEVEAPTLSKHFNRRVGDRRCTFARVGRRVAVGGDEPARRLLLVGMRQHHITQHGCGKPHSWSRDQGTPRFEVKFYHVGTSAPDGAAQGLTRVISCEVDAGTGVGFNPVITARFE